MKSTKTQSLLILRELSPSALDSTRLPRNRSRRCLTALLILPALLIGLTGHAQTNYEPYSFTTFAGLAGSGSANGSGASARFNGPQSTAVDISGNIYVADGGNNTVRKITSSGDVTTLAGQAGSAGSTDGTGSSARFNFPSGIAVDSAGDLYVADTNNHTIRKITAAGVVSTLAGNVGANGNTDGTGSAARFNGPRGVAVDSSGIVYVADTKNFAIRMITPAGVVTTLAGPSGGYFLPQGVAVDASGILYVADTDNYTIRKRTPDGTHTILAGTPGFAGTADGTGSAVRFNRPEAWHATIRGMFL
jgi:sugar lactone lactonase YvrE